MLLEGFLRVNHLLTTRRFLQSLLHIVVSPASRCGYMQNLSHMAEHREYHDILVTFLDNEMVSVRLLSSLYLCMNQPNTCVLFSVALRLCA